MDAGINKVRTTRYVDIISEETERDFKSFLEEFKEGEKIKYEELVSKMDAQEKSSLPVSFNDLKEFNDALSDRVLLSFFKYFPILCRATKKFVNEKIPETENNGRDYLCHFVDCPVMTSLRNLKSENLGKLQRFRAQVIRSHAVHPELINGSFKCTDCLTVTKYVEQEFIFTKPTICSNPQCMNRTKFDLIIDESKFIDFQKVRVQEAPGEIPRGCVPRSMDVILRYEMVEMAQPGDLCEFIGTPIVIPDVTQIAMAGSRTMESKPIKITDGYESGITGLKSLGVRDLTYKTAFLASNVMTINNRYVQSEDLQEDGQVTYSSLEKKMTPEELNKVMLMNEDPNLVSKLCSSLFPNVYGNDEVKRGLILMLFGGVPKVTGEGTKLRGDINICIVGDPSTAKSQFLKRIAAFAPRAVYTSGKASSAAGLTAAVVRDQDSSEFVIEAGALMLANNGICCIDEFDKMDVRDQVAIHEAMEQQTITLTKAGIKATLNARASVLAAANPIGGRYDRSRSLRQNISLSAPIMSRFDLFFVLVDECTEQVDYEIAKRIINFHVDGNLQDTEANNYSDDDIRRYISFSRCFEPRITMPAYRLMVSEYKKMRARDASSGSQSAWRITVRQLESLVRLSEATARMRFSDYVEEVDVMEANKLLNKSIIRVEQPDINLSESYTITNDTDNNMDMEVDRHMVTYDEYSRVTSALIGYLRIIENSDQEDVHVKQSELVDWYLESIIDTIADEDVLVAKKEIVTMIIKRLIDKDNVLLAVYRRNPYEKGESFDNDPLITLHPNVPLE